MNLADPAWYMEVRPCVYAPLGQALTGCASEVKGQLLRCRALDGTWAAYGPEQETACDIGPFFASGEDDPVLCKLAQLLKGGVCGEAFKTGLVAVRPGKSARRQEAYIELLGRQHGGISFRLHFTGRAEEGEFDRVALRFIPGGKVGLKL